MGGIIKCVELVTNCVYLFYFSSSSLKSLEVLLWYLGRPEEVLLWYLGRPEEVLLSFLGRPEEVLLWFLSKDVLKTF